MILRSLLFSVLNCFLLTEISESSTLCPPVNWTYNAIAGKCYRFNSGLALNYSEALASCQSKGGSLIQVLGEAEKLGFSNYLYHLTGFAAEAWTSATWNGSTLHWPSGEKVSSYWYNATTGISQTGDCAIIKNKVSASGVSEWNYQVSIVRTDCDLKKPVLCEKSVTKCDPTAISGYSSTRMRIKNVTTFSNSPLYDLHNPTIMSHVLCKPGFYRERDSPIKVVTDPPLLNGMAVNTAKCEMNSSYSYGVIEPCNPVQCNAEMLKKDTPIPHVESYTHLINQTFYAYNAILPVVCKSGYVSHYNSSKTSSQLTCGQHPLDPTQGEWQPPDLNTCLPVECPDWSTVVNPSSVAYKAINRIDKKEYGEFQLSSFPKFPNRVHIKCKEKGYFFEDRQFDKTVLCDLKNGSATEGAWQGTLGTEIGRLIALDCVPVSCLSEDLIQRSEEANKQVEGLHYLQNVTIVDQNAHTVTSVSLTSVNEPLTYPYNIIMKFQCQDNMATGLGNPNVICKSDGKWNITQLPACTKISEPVVVASGKKHYVPPPKEAASAGSVGAVTIVIVLIFSIFIITLDLSTLSRDITLLKKNVQRIKTYTRERKLKSNSMD